MPNINDRIPTISHGIGIQMAFGLMTIVTNNPPKIRINAPQKIRTRMPEVILIAPGRSDKDGCELEDCERRERIQRGGFDLGRGGDSGGSVGSLEVNLDVLIGSGETFDVFASIGENFGLIGTLSCPQPMQKVAPPEFFAPQDLQIQAAVSFSIRIHILPSKPSEVNC